MSVKTILVQLNSDSDDNPQIKAAIDLALKYKAHLCGLYVIQRLNLPTYAGAYIPAGVLQAHEDLEQEIAEKARAEFENMVAEAGCSNEWHCVHGYTDQQINILGRYADLIVIAQTRDHNVLSNDMSVEDHVLVDSPRPILFVPYIGVGPTIGNRILVAWNGTRESARAVSDALPFLTRAEAVEVVSVSKSEAKSEDTLENVCKFLKRHEVNATANPVVSKDLSVSDTLLARASDNGFDMIVMGAYGHSRFREYIFGGATHHMLNHMTVPVLMSH